MSPRLGSNDFELLSASSGYMVLGIESRALCTPERHFTNQATSLTQDEDFKPYRVSIPFLCFSAALGIEPAAYGTDSSQDPVPPIPFYTTPGAQTGKH